MAAAREPQRRMRRMRRMRRGLTIPHMAWERCPGFQLRRDASGLALRWGLIPSVMDVGFVLVFIAACALLELAVLQTLIDGTGSPNNPAYGNDPRRLGLLEA